MLALIAVAALSYTFMYIAIANAIRGGELNERMGNEARRQFQAARKLWK